jgi:transcriptional regulator with XRE-family HTH domain
MNLRKRKKGGMRLFNRQKFRASVIEAGLSMDDVARYLGINTATLYRKLNGSSEFTRIEIQVLQKILSLDMSKTAEIFFA